MAKILITDDETAIRNTLAGILEDEGHKTVLAESGEEAIAHFARDEFDLAILDLWLPGIDGLSVLERIKGAAGDRHLRPRQHRHSGPRHAPRRVRLPGEAALPRARAAHGQSRPGRPPA